LLEPLALFTLSTHPQLDCLLVPFFKIIRTHWQTRPFRGPFLHTRHFSSAMAFFYLVIFYRCRRHHRRNAHPPFFNSCLPRRCLHALCGPSIGMSSTAFLTRLLVIVPPLVFAIKIIAFFLFTMIMMYPPPAARVYNTFLTFFYTTRCRAVCLLLPSFGLVARLSPDLLLLLSSLIVSLVYLALRVCGLRHSIIQKQNVMDR